MKQSSYKWFASVLSAATLMSVITGCMSGSGGQVLQNGAKNSNQTPNAVQEKTPEETPINALKDARKPTSNGGKPNVIVIMADDLGYGDTDLYVNANADTPNINSIAANGTLFTQAYAAAPVCSPSRTGLFSSLPPGYLGADNNSSGRDSAERIPAYTLATAMKEQGYASLYVGKWDLGTEDEYLPVARGFDGFYGIPGGISNYYPKKQNKQTAEAWHLKNKKAVKGGEVTSQWGINVREYNPSSKKYVPANEQEYLTDAFTREALKFIDLKAANKESFFLYLSYNAPHVPLQAPDDHYQKYAHIKDPKERIFAAMVDAVDEGVGSVLKKLEEKGISDNTIVAFVSDNGPEEGDSGGLRGKKFDLFEGGIRVPFVMQWPAQYAKSKKYNEPVSLMDILPTLANAAGHDAASLKSKHNFEGADLTPYLTGEKASGTPHDDLFWRFAKGDTSEIHYALRSGDLKLVRVTDQNKKETEYLFDIAKDTKEQTNLISDSQYKTKAVELKAKLDKWNQDHPINLNVSKDKNE